MLLVHFVSSSHGHSIATVNRILDSYAERIGPCVWQANVTIKALESIRLALRRHATKQFEVVCRHIHGFSHRRSSVLWTVGRRRINGDGLFPILSTSKKIFRNKKQRNNMIAIAARDAGFVHDIGKNTPFFQNKLRSGSHQSDAVRHELMSLLMIEQGEMSKVKSIINDYPALRPRFITEDHIDIMGWLVASHHRLPGEFWLTEKHIMNEKVKSFSEMLNDDYAPMQPKTWVSYQFNQPIITGFMARMGLMLADHYVSSIKKSDPVRSSMHGITQRMIQKPKVNDIKANHEQTLKSHLHAVGRTAQWMTQYLVDATLVQSLPSLVDHEFNAIDTTHPKFKWQGDVVKMIHAINSDDLKKPMLALVCSSTGSGKTMACAMIADALCARKGLGTRITVALGLRTLTLQTGRAYRDKLNLSIDKLAVLIGDKHVSSLENATHDDEENNRLLETDIDDSGIRFCIPSFLEHEFRGKTSYLATPVLVTTIDQIIESADLRRSKWIAPTLRIMSSPIIIDEIDSFNHEDIIVICRLIYLCGMIGQDVICSTATMYPSLAERIMQSYHEGSLQSIHGSSPLIGLFSDTPNASVVKNCEDIDYKEFVAKHTIHVCHKRKLGFLPDYASTQLLFNDILNQCIQCHHEFNQIHDDMSFSVGLIRLAHVKNVVNMARTIEIMSARIEKIGIVVIPYHSRNTLLSRAFIENKLDAMLSRTSDEHAPFKDNDVKKHWERAKKNGQHGLVVIVVSSPIEETGRDHDFDWAIVEPSSTRSVVQVAGRVMRHRSMSEPKLPNVLLMRKPLIAMEKTSKILPYSFPGFNSKDINYQYGDYDSMKLFNGSDNVINASWCMNPLMTLASIENVAIDSELENGLLSIFQSSFSLTSNHFNKYVFRRETIEKEQAYLVDDTLRRMEDNGKIDHIQVQQWGGNHWLVDENTDIISFWEEKMKKDFNHDDIKKFMSIDVRTSDQYIHPIFGIC